MLLKIKKVDSKMVFPQANDIHKVIKFVDEMTYNYHQSTLKSVNLDVVSRQHLYYKSAATYLGMIEDNKPTVIADHIFKLDKNALLINIAQLILENEIFFNFYQNRDINSIISMLKFHYNMNHSTSVRRASTVKSWVQWCDYILKENYIMIEVDNNGLS